MLKNKSDIPTILAQGAPCRSETKTFKSYNASYPSTRHLLIAVSTVVIHILHSFLGVYKVRCLWFYTSKAVPQPLPYHTFQTFFYQTRAHVRFWFIADETKRSHRRPVTNRLKSDCLPAAVNMHLSSISVVGFRLRTAGKQKVILRMPPPILFVATRPR